MYMQTVLLGLATALLWGVADTLAAKVSQRMGSAATTLLAQVAGLLLAGLLTLLVSLPTDLTLAAFIESMLSGLLLGAVAALAYLTLYQALAQGPLAIVSPLVSAQGGVTLLAAIIVLHELPDWWQLVFLGVTFVGVLLATLNGGEVRRLVRAGSLPGLLSPGIALALVSMLGFGLLAFGLGAASRASDWLLCVVWTRLFSCLLLAVFLRPDWTRQANAGQPVAEKATSASRPHHHRWLWGAGAVLVGCADVGGLLLLSLASTIGSIGVVGMLASAYGIIPLLAGLVIFKERPASNQVLGVALLIAGLPGVAAPSPTLAWPELAAVGVLVLACVSRTLLSSWLALPPPWTAVARALRALAPCQQHALHRLLRETVAGLRTLAADHTPPCVAFFGGSPPATADAATARVAYETARLLAEAGLGILTTAHNGLMEAAKQGACDGEMLSVACLLQAAGHEAEAAAEEGRPACQKVVVVRFSSMVSYQMTISSAACALVFFPGSLDTIEGLAQAIRAMQRGEMNRVPIVLYGRAFWTRLFDGMPDTFEGVSELLHLCDEPTGIATFITAHLFADHSRPSAQEGQPAAPALSLTSKLSITSKS
jgi:predicted Rossmann-fold nucleotide-binding protein/drug/metabolite transporter (DMT)-like permease